MIRISVSQMTLKRIQVKRTLVNFVAGLMFFLCGQSFEIYIILLI